MKSFSGCWTCRLRRKKCPENHPVCDTCASLHITCYYEQDKPEWMDGGAKQEEMAKRLKREVKESSRQRRVDRAVDISNEHITDRAASSEDFGNPSLSECSFLETSSNLHNDGVDALYSVRRLSGSDSMFTKKIARLDIAIEPSDTVLLMFYLENVFPFLFPFYHPSPLQGGRAWILELMIKSPVVRQALISQSSYFFSIAQRSSNGDTLCKSVFTQTRDAFDILRKALQVICGSNVNEHIHGAARILTSIIQVLRFDIAISSFDNCRTHLNAAVALFRQICDSSDTAELATRFKIVMSRLKSSSDNSSMRNLGIPSAEQIAFQFSSSLLIMDDIVASTVLQERPDLYDYHRDLLGEISDCDRLINLETVVGCQNWVLQQVSEIAVLDAWKQQCKRVGSLDIMELAHRGSVIKSLLEANLTRLETDSMLAPKGADNFFNVFADYQKSKSLASHNCSVTLVWAHAALLYLFVVISGWQPANFEVRYHVGRIIEILACQTSPPTMLRSVVWPFCVAGCLAEPMREAHFRTMVEALQPQIVFGTVCKALEIMENVWRDRIVNDIADRDLASCFRGSGGLVLLV